jgi:hypothetical protein
MRPGFGTALALLLATSSGLGQTPQADRLIAEGVELRRAGDEQAAFERFRQAYELSPSPRAQGQMGLAAKSLRLWLDAERHLQGALYSTADPWVEKNRAALQQALDVVVTNVASLRVETNAAHAKLFLNGREIAELPMKAPVRVLAGAAELEVHAKGYRTAVRRETLPARRETSLRIELVADTPAPPVAPEKTPAASPAPAAPAPSTEKDAGAGAMSSQRTWAYVAGGIGVVGVGVGTYFGLRTLSLKNERDEECPETECTSERGVDLDESARSAALVSTIGFGVGVAALGTGLVLWLTEPDRDAETAGVSAAIGPSSASASLRLSF